MGLFYIESSLQITWDDLLADLSKVTSYNSYCFETSYYDIFKAIIVSLLIHKDIILLDCDYTESELLKISASNNLSCFNEELKNVSALKLSSKEQLISRLLDVPNTWKVFIFSSGTTGIPKKVGHTFSGITRFVKRGEERGNDVWGFAYNPTHIAGIQVFFQALLNGNSIIRLFGLKQSQIYNLIKRYNITHVSATPTFYRLIINFDESFLSVKNITSGGEKLSQTLIDSIKKIFPNAKIRNVYASTEAGSLFASENDIFTIRSEFNDLVKVIDKELFIHKDLLGLSDTFSSLWYGTGDLVEVLSSTPLAIKFISRNNSLINVGGYQVNLSEVEDVLCSHSSVKLVFVYAKKNSLIGNVICCDVVSSNAELTETELRSFLKLHMQEHKIPRIIRFVDDLEKTNSGKIRRSK